MLPNHAIWLRFIAMTVAKLSNYIYKIETQHVYNEFILAFRFIT